MASGSAALVKRPMPMATENLLGNGNGSEGHTSQIWKGEVAGSDNPVMLLRVHQPLGPQSEVDKPARKPFRYWHTKEAFAATREKVQKFKEEHGRSPNSLELYPFALYFIKAKRREGKSMHRIRSMLGVSKLEPRGPKVKNADRDLEILRMRHNEGMRMEAIGDKVGITKARVEQILARQEAVASLTERDILTALREMRRAAKSAKQKTESPPAAMQVALLRTAA